MNNGARTVLITATMLILACVGFAIHMIAATGKIVAQKAIEEIKAAHSEVSSVELNAIRSEKEGCATVAATGVKEMGAKCDTSDLIAMKTNQTLVEQEKHGYDVTVPLLDSSGEVMATVGLDFKSGKAPSKSAVKIKGERIASEFLKTFKSRDQLFESVE